MNFNPLLRHRPVFSPEGAEGAPAPSDAPPATPVAGVASSPDGAGAASDAAGSEVGGAEDNDWMNLGRSDDDFEPKEVIAPPTAPSPEGKPAEAKVAPAPATQEPQKAPVPPAAEATKPPQAAQPAAEGAPAKPDIQAADASPEGLATQLAQHRDKIIDGLAAQHFTLSKEEVELITADPAAAIPRMMAKTFYEAQQAALMHMQNYVPKLVMSLMKDLRDQEEVEGRFYGKFPTLDKKKHHQDVLKMARAFRANDKSIKEDDLFSMVGAAVLAKYGLAPAPAVVNGGTPPVAPPAFVPASRGTGGARVTKQVVEESPWDGLGKNYDDEGE